MWLSLCFFIVIIASVFLDLVGSLYYKIHTHTYIYIWQIVFFSDYVLCVPIRRIQICDSQQFQRNDRLYDGNQQLGKVPDLYDWNKGQSLQVVRCVGMSVSDWVERGGYYYHSVYLESGSN